MEENTQETCCSLKSNKKCLTKIVIIGIALCLISFLLGFYCGSKSNKAPRRIANRPGFVNPMQQRRLPPPNMPRNIQRPPIQRVQPKPKLPNIPKQNIQKPVAKKVTAPTQTKK